MKIDNDTSTLFVKQDLFANISPKKASNATGKALDNILIADRNKFEQDISADSYIVDINNTQSTTNNNTNVILYHDKYYNYDDSIWSAHEAIEYTEVFIGEALYWNDKNPGAFAESMSHVARSLNTYLRFQSDTDSLKDDAYLNSLQERFDALDPNCEDNVLNQLRDLVSTTRKGKVIEVSEKNFTCQAEFDADIEDNLGNINAKNNNAENNQSELAKAQKQNYIATMTQTVNNANIMAKLLNNKANPNAGYALADISNINAKTEDSADAQEKQSLFNSLQDNDDIDANMQKDKQNISARSILKLDWKIASTIYAQQHKDIAGLYDSYCNYAQPCKGIAGLYYSYCSKDNASNASTSDNSNTSENKTQTSYDLFV